MFKAMNVHGDAMHTMLDGLDMMPEMKMKPEIVQLLEDFNNEHPEASCKLCMLIYVVLIILLKQASASSDAAAASAAPDPQELNMFIV